jgi:hypothetical protein
MIPLHLSGTSNFISEGTREAICALFDTIKEKLQRYATSKQDFTTAYRAAVYAHYDELGKILDEITADFMMNMPDVYSIGDKMFHGDGSAYYITESNVQHENDSRRRNEAMSYVRLPDYWEDELRLIYVEAASGN